MMPCNVYRSLALMLTVLIAGISAITAPVGAQTSTSTATATSGGAVAVVYHPPLRGAPAGRIGGASRGGAPGVALPALEVLAPDHVGLTAREQPTLYWFISGPVTAPVQLTITAEDSEKPLLEVEVPRPVVPGIHSFRLADYGVRLHADTEYQWSVAVIVDPKERSKDVLASGLIRRVINPTASAVKAAVARDPIVVAQDAAAAGLWYDALDALSQSVGRTAGGHRERLQRASLLQQVGLNEAAAFERAAK